MANENLYKPSEMPSAIHELGEQLNSAKYGFEKIEEAIEYSKDGTQYESDLIIAKNTILEDNTYFEDIGEAIAEKDGGEIPEKSEMAERIENIPTGSTQVQNPALILWDWEGTKLAEYSAEDALALTELPSPGTLPAYAYVDHELLLFQKWNWSLANIKTWIQNHEDKTLDVGAIYTTTDGQDHNYWDSPRGEGVDLISRQRRGEASIGDYAFNACCSLASINIPDGATSIGDYAFNACCSLASINIPDSVTSIEASAFDGCYSLKSINISDSVTSIGSYAFAVCRSLKSINISDSVTSIGHSAFINCKNLFDILLEGKPAFPDFNVFAGIPSTVKVYVPRENFSWFEAITDGTDYYSVFTTIEDNIAYLESLGYNVDEYKEADS